jgi:hypothetical protein
MDQEYQDLKKKTLKRLFISTGLAIAIFSLCYWFIPINIYQSATILIALLGSISLTITVLGSVVLALSLLYPGPSKASNIEGIIYGVVIIGTLFGSGALFIYREIQLEQIELEQYGELTTAHVTDGSSFATRRIDLTDVTLKFIKKNGEEWTVKHSISKSQFDYFYEGQQVPIVYSTRYPTVMEVLYTPEAMQKY